MSTGRDKNKMDLEEIKEIIIIIKSTKQIKIRVLKCLGEKEFLNWSDCFWEIKETDLFLLLGAA